MNCITLIVGELLFKYTSYDDYTVVERKNNPLEISYGNLYCCPSSKDGKLDY